MPLITALLHTKNDSLRLGRCLETLYPCDHILIIDHASRDATVQVARDYGARIISPAPGATPDIYLQSAIPAAIAGWILSLDPRESLTEGLAASLFEWKSESAPSATPTPYSVFLREETAQGWIELPAPQTRLVPAVWNRWNANIPIHDPSAAALEGELLRFVFP
jgi:glycosyltransferase involved in cell wall biosynthesis